MTVTGPAEPAGAVKLSVVAVFVLMVAAALPNVTEVAPNRFVPVMLTSVPAASGPESGEMTVMVGAGVGVVTVYTAELEALRRVVVPLSLTMR